MKSRPGFSLRSKFILIVLGGAVLPLALLGVWLSRTAERSGEHLLRARLESSLGEIVDGIGLRWLNRRSQLLRLAESPWVQDVLGGGDGSGPRAAESLDPPSGLTELFSSMGADVLSVAVMTPSGEVVWNLGPESGSPSGASLSDPALTVRIPVYEMGTGRSIGALTAGVRIHTLLPGGASWGGVSGSVLAVLDPSTGASLLPLSIDPALFTREEFVWGEEPWITVHRTLLEPAMNLALAAPVTPFAEPFQEAARRNLWILLVVAVAGFFLAAVMTRALGEIDRVNRSVTGALRVARSGSVQLETIDVRQPIEAALHTAQPELEAHGAERILALPPGGPVWVKGDGVALEQLFLNLLLNAAQAVEPGGKVSVAVSREEDSVVVAVEDSGRGIPAEDLQRVFEPFFSTRAEGTGLGLAIAQRIAQAHGSGLEFESTPGMGTTARLSLALSNPDPTIAPDAETRRNGTTRQM